MAHQAVAYPGFCSKKQPIVFLLLPLDAMLINCRATPRILFIHLGGEGYCESKVTLPKNTTQWCRAGLEPEPLAVELSTLTMKPPHLSQFDVSALQYLFVRFIWIKLQGMQLL